MKCPRKKKNLKRNVLPKTHLPSIDLHGEFAVTAYTVVNEFISDQIKLKNTEVSIIHGKGSGKLKEEVHHILKKDKRVISFHLNPYNLGETLVFLVSKK